MADECVLDPGNFFFFGGGKIKKSVFEYILLPD